MLAHQSRRLPVESFYNGSLAKINAVKKQDSKLRYLFNFRAKLSFEISRPFPAAEAIQTRYYPAEHKFMSGDEISSFFFERIAN